MKNINFALIWDYVKTYIIPIVLIVLLINMCNNAPVGKLAVTKADYKRLTNDNKLLQERMKTVLYQSIVAKKELQKKDSLIALVQLERDNLKQQLDYVVKDGKKKREDVLKLDNKGLADNINERFKTDAAIVTAKGIELTKDLPVKVVSTLVDGEVAKAELSITRKYLKNTFDELNLVTGQVTILKDDNQRLNSSLIETISMTNELQTLATDQNKVITKLNRKRKLNKFLVPAGMITAFIAGIYIAK